MSIMAVMIKEYTLLKILIGLLIKQWAGGAS